MLSRLRMASGASRREPERDLGTGRRLRVTGPARFLEHLAQRVFGRGDLLAEPQAELGVGEPDLAILLVRRHRAGLEVLSRDAELARERSDRLHRGSPLARLDPRDVGVAYARPGQLPLGHAAIESQPAEPDRDGLWAAHSSPSLPLPGEIVNRLSVVSS